MIGAALSRGCSKKVLGFWILGSRLIGNNGAKKSHFGPIEKKLTRTLPFDGFFLVSSPEKVGSKVWYRRIVSSCAQVFE